MSKLHPATDSALLVGPETADDAGVYRLSADLALVETVDIITPLVDDPYTFGRIAAANALSDVYAMGGKPVTALNLAFFPACSMPAELLSYILAGGQSMLAEAGVCLTGGHTVEDDELKYGLSVTGTIHPDRIVRNSTAKVGDSLYLTKPIGFGIISTAIKADMADKGVIDEAVRWMTTLNDRASQLMIECGANACTDVTGFGLIGHACEMARGAGVSIRLNIDDIPVVNGVQELIRDGLIPAGCYRNRDYFGSSVTIDSRFTVHDAPVIPLFDPQTSGGLLIAVASESCARFEREASRRGVAAVCIGEVVSSDKDSVILR
ncbi:selenide, water dikinase [Geobacter sp. OR-1]|nr:selenide, water dikinase [Geobacter sp. OR-1]